MLGYTKTQYLHVNRYFRSLLWWLWVITPQNKPETRYSFCSSNCTSRGACTWHPSMHHLKWSIKCAGTWHGRVCTWINNLIPLEFSIGRIVLYAYHAISWPGQSIGIFFGMLNITRKCCIEILEEYNDTAEFRSLFGIMAPTACHYCKSENHKQIKHKQGYKHVNNRLFAVL